MVAAATSLLVSVPDTRCTVDDPELAELSGMVVDRGAVWAMSDGGPRVDLHRLDSDCAISDTRTVRIDPYDTEDVARGPDGSPVVADTGDNRRARDTIAVIVLPARGDARMHRLSYPDGPHDAEALLVEADGRPVVITKEVGPAGVYRTAEPPDGTGPTPLERVGEVVLPASDTAGGPVGDLGSRLVTGAAASADGRVVALRTYTDAWLYPVSNGDVAGALGGVPVQVPLPGEPQGEAIAFEPDGTLLSGSEARGGVPGEIRAVPGAAGLVSDLPPTDVPPPAPAAAEPAAPVGDSAMSWLPAALGAGAVVGFLLLVMAMLGLRDGTRRR